MGASLTMIDRHYGQLAVDGNAHGIRLLDLYSAEQKTRWTPVDATRTSEPADLAVVDDETSPQAGNTEAL